mgnify:CR=1 FL=1|jgi:sigma-E factor negative regulatory protein RseC
MIAMANNNKYDGIVECIDGYHLKVKIVRQDLCGSCAVKHHCGMEAEECRIDVYNKYAISCKIGDRVIISSQKSFLGLRAALWAFVYPFIVLLITFVLALYLLSRNEILSISIAMMSLALYYLILYLFRRKMSHVFLFILESKAI